MQLSVQAREIWKPNKRFQIKRKERKQLAVQVNVFSSMSSFGIIPFYFLSSIVLLILALFSIWSLVQKGFKLACNCSSIFKHLAIVSLQTWEKKILLMARISASTLDIQIRISWASNIEIKWFKSSNLSTRLGLQLWWKSWSEIKSF